MFVNFTNHPSGQWGERQLREALKYADAAQGRDSAAGRGSEEIRGCMDMGRLMDESLEHIADIPFPAVDADGDEAYISALAAEYAEKILAYKPDAVLCQGEFCLAFQVAALLKEKGVTVLAACSERCVRQKGDVKEAVFSFRRFRRY